MIYKVNIFQRINFIKLFYSKEIKILIGDEEDMKKDIKIVAVISSPNFNGNTAALVREALNGAKKEGAKKVSKKLTEVFKAGIFERSYISGTLGVHTRINGVEKKVCESTDDLKKANELGRKIAKDIKFNNRYPFQNLIMRAVAALYLKPIFKKFISKNKEDKERASYYSLHQRGLI
jgi:hypothetical protein